MGTSKYYYLQDLVGNPLNININVQNCADSCCKLPEPLCSAHKKMLSVHFDRTT